MVPCRSCGNDSFTLELRCAHCGAYLRDRVPSLNLFSTLWGMIESPATTALRIGRSEQKNYTHLLFALAGPLLVAITLFAARVGDAMIPFASILAATVLAGLLSGLLLFPLMALWQRMLMRLLFGVSIGYRESAAWIAWSLSPLMWASVIVLPLLLGLFGSLLFASDPAPWDVLPFPFWSLGILCATTVPWSMLLLPLGFRVHGVSYRRLLLQQLATWLLPAAAIAFGVAFLRSTV
jgi:hypothetical protein